MFVGEARRVDGLAPSLVAYSSASTPIPRPLRSELKASALSDGCGSPTVCQVSPSLAVCSTSPSAKA
jgi:hypothetical protein